ncbi:hypothetical protein PISMIDRAFT_48730, partial [Pisolithus microcarpus 441]
PVVLQEYQVIEHRLPTGSDPTPKAGGCVSLPPNEAIAKSRQLKRAKEVSSEIIGVNVIYRNEPLKVEKFGI